MVIATRTWTNIATWILGGYMIALLLSAIYGFYLSDQDDNTGWVWNVSSCGGFLLIGLIGWLFASWKDQNKSGDSHAANQG